VLLIEEQHSNLRLPQNFLEQDVQTATNPEPVNTNQAEQVKPSTSTLQMAGDEKTGRRERRKRKIGGLDDCLCGSRAVSTEEGVIQCKRVGCETGWYHLICISLEQVPRGGRGGKAARR